MFYRNPILEVRLCVACCLTLITWESNGQTLGDLVERAKIARGAQSAKPAVPPSMSAPKSATRPPLPLLWSLSGLDSELKATFIFDSKVILVDSLDTDSWKIGPWRVNEISANGIEISSEAGHKKFKASIKPLPLGASVQPYLQQLSAASPFPASSPMNLPVTANTQLSAQAIASQLPGAIPLAPLTPLTPLTPLSPIAPAVPTAPTLPNNLASTPR